MSGLVTVAANLWPWDAHMLRGGLAAEGIFAIVTGEYGIEGVPAACARVLVHAENGARALEFIRELDRSSPPPSSS
jgi:hypothetical protein